MAQPDETIAGYRLLRQLGTRPKGEVWKATDAGGRPVALRLLPDGDDESRLRRLRDDVATLQQLAHPNVAAVLDAGRADGATWLATEFVTGAPLGGRGPMDTAGFFHVALPLASAVAAANDDGLIHGDLSPRNVVITPEGTVKVLDFCAREVHHAEPPTGLNPDEVPTETLTHERDLGSDALPYCPPERVQGKPLDIRADTYSLGAVLYEIATGNPPFVAETNADLIVAVLRDMPAPISTDNPRLPAELDRVLGRALVKDRAKRLQSARFLLQDLQRLADSSGS